MAAPLRGSPWQQSLNPSWRAQRSHSSSVHRHQHPCQVLNEHTHPVRDVAVAGQHRVTVCDKANILNSYAFFRAVATEVAQSYPDVEIDYAYADAITRAHDQEARLLRRDCGQKHVWRHHLRSRCRHGGQPGRGFIGRAGRTPRPVPGCARLGPRHCRERRCHPVATMLSAALMLRWLAERHTMQPSRKMPCASKPPSRQCWPKALSCPLIRAAWPAAESSRKRCCGSCAEGVNERVSGL